MLTIQPNSAFPEKRNVDFPIHYYNVIKIIQWICFQNLDNKMFLEKKNPQETSIYRD